MTEQTSPAEPTAGRPWWARPVGRAERTGLAAVQLALDLPIGIVTFTLTVLTLALSVGLLPLFLLGLVVFRGSGFLTRWLATAERARHGLLLDLALPAPTAPATWRAELTDAATWRARGYLLARLPIGIVTCTVGALAWALPLVLITMPLYRTALPDGVTVHLGPVSVDGPVGLTVAVLIGLALLAVAPAVVRGLALLDTAVARALLGGQTAAVMAARVDHLEKTRSAVVDAATAERRRIERDLHDGAQQRLVSLAMDLDRARARFDSDPAAARAIVDDAHAQAKAALTELRDLTRGLYPAVLTDRGLDAALSGLVSRSPIPVTLDVDLADRCPPAIEAIAYFVTAEALTNIARHSGATAARVTVRRGRTPGTAPDRLVITVTDNGAGGADPARGTGLSGLADRVAAVDGTFTVDSPVGGPTTITAELPCAS